MVGGAAAGERERPKLHDCFTQFRRRVHYPQPDRAARSGLTSGRQRPSIL
jgi:hypothetical protein